VQRVVDPGLAGAFGGGGDESPYFRDRHREIRVGEKSPRAPRVEHSAPDRRAFPGVRSADELYSRIHRHGVRDDRRRPVRASIVHDDHLGIDAKSIDLGGDCGDRVRDPRVLVVRGDDHRQKWGIHRRVERTI